MGTWKAPIADLKVQTVMMRVVRSAVIVRSDDMNAFKMDSVIMVNGEDIEAWSVEHIARLAFTRTIVGFINVALGLLIVVKVFGLV